MGSYIEGVWVSLWLWGLDYVVYVLGGFWEVIKVRLGLLDYRGIIILGMWLCRDSLDIFIFVVISRLWNRGKKK